MAKKVNTNTQATKAAKRTSTAAKLKGLQLLGEIITWNARSDGEHTHTDVVNALNKADLDSDLARELLPRFAFARAARKMTEDRMIDAVNETEDVIVFQFTKKFMDKEEWQFKRETFLRLDKTSGRITCNDTELQECAQAELDKAMTARTTNDITKIVQRLFEDNADLFPVRDQGGVYFVPSEHTLFIAKVETFLTALGGSIMRFPVPAGTQQGNSAVKESVSNALQSLINDHNEAVEHFTLNTRSDTLENAAEKIKATRVKIEAYANYLQDRSADLLKEVEAANAKLVTQVEALSKQREKAPAKSGDGKVFGYPVTAVLRWMGVNDWNFDKAREALHAKGIGVADGTIRAQLAAGRKGQRGAPADLTKKQAKELTPTLAKTK